jgi:hypothetical protein
LNALLLSCDPPPISRSDNPFYLHNSSLIMHSAFFSLQLQNKDSQPSKNWWGYISASVRSCRIAVANSTCMHRSSGSKSALYMKLLPVFCSPHNVCWTWLCIRHNFSVYARNAAAMKQRPIFSIIGGNGDVCRHSTCRNSHNTM